MLLSSVLQGVSLVVVIHEILYSSLLTNILGPALKNSSMELLGVCRRWGSYKPNGFGVKLSSNVVKIASIEHRFLNNYILNISYAQKGCELRLQKVTFTTLFLYPPNLKNLVMIKFYNFR